MLQKHIILGFVSTFLLAGCAHTGTAPETITTPEAESTIQDENPEVINDGTEEEMMENEVTIDASNFMFSQDTITAKAGETLTIVLTNSEGMHNFIIDELDVQSETIEAGEDTTITIEIPADAAGQSYAYYCGIGNHRAMGMEGMLTVE
jgi:plastocyanin